MSVAIVGIQGLERRFLLSVDWTAGLWSLVVQSRDSLSLQES